MIETQRYLQACRTEFWQKVFRAEADYVAGCLNGCVDVLSVGCGSASVEGALSARGFQTQTARAESYVSKILHIDLTEIEQVIAGLFDIQTEYFLGVTGTTIFACRTANEAVWYIIKGTRKHLPA